MNRISNLVKSSLKITYNAFHTSALLRRQLYFVQTSRDIEFKIKQERSKNVLNKFRAIESSFGLSRPEKVSSDYPRPQTYTFTPQSLRRCSHMYPQYLLNELNNSKSQFYEVLQTLFEGLAAAQNQEALQFLQFLVVWKLYLNNGEFEEMLVRKIYQMKMNLQQLFTVLKIVVQIQTEKTRKEIMVNVENKILERIIDIEHYEYQSLFRIVNFMRINDLSPKIKPQTLKAVMNQQNKQESSEQNKQQSKQQPNSPQQQKLQPNEDSFFKIVELVLLRNLTDIPLPNLVQMVVHYANNVKQNQDDKIQILKKVEPRIIENLPFFTHEELIAIMYSYIKTETHSDTLIKEFVRRVELLYYEISWENKRKILNLASSLPHNKWLYLTGLSLFEVLKGKKIINRQGQSQNDPDAKEVEYQLLPAIYLAAYETDLLTTQIVDKLQPRILTNIFNYPAADVALVAWLFTITPQSMVPKRQNKDLLYTKLQSIVVGGFSSSSFTLKDISMVVWALCNCGGKSNQVYKQNADFWTNIEFYIQQRISNQKEERLINGCCQIMWAYLNNKALSLKTINIILDALVEKENTNELAEHMFNFELITITSFFYSLQSSLPPPIIQFVHKLCTKYFNLLLEEMDYLQIIKMLKFILYNSKDQMQTQVLTAEQWSKIINQFHIDQDKIEYPYIMAVVGFTVVSPQGKKAEQKAVEVVTRLMARKKQMEQLQKTHQPQHRE